MVKWVKESHVLEAVATIPQLEALALAPSEVSFSKVLAVHSLLLLPHLVLLTMSLSACSLLLL